jgi:hypothetical protein
VQGGDWAWGGADERGAGGGDLLGTGTDALARSHWNGWGSGWPAEAGWRRGGTG